MNEYQRIDLQTKYDSKIGDHLSPEVSGNIFLSHVKSHSAGIYEVAWLAKSRNLERKGRLMVSQGNKKTHKRLPMAGRKTQGVQVTTVFGEFCPDFLLLRAYVLDSQVSVQISDRIYIPFRSRCSDIHHGFYRVHHKNGQLYE